MLLNAGCCSSYMGTCCCRYPTKKGGLHGQVIEVGLQLVIMLSPIRTFFKVGEQDWGEWLFALVTGFGSLIVALLVKLVTRCSPSLSPCPPPFLMRLQVMRVGLSSVQCPSRRNCCSNVSLGARAYDMDQVRLSLIGLRWVLSTAQRVPALLCNPKLP